MISKLLLKTKCFTCRLLNMLKGEDKIVRRSREAFNFLPTRLQRGNAVIIRFQCNHQYVLPTRLQRAEMQWLLNFSVTIRYCSTHEVTESRNAVIIRFQCNHQVRSTHATRLQRANAVIIRFQCNHQYVLPTRLQRAEMQWLLNFSVTIRYCSTHEVTESRNAVIIRFQCNHQVRSTHATRLQRANAVIIRFQCNHRICSTHEVTESQNAVIIRFQCNHQVCSTHKVTASTCIDNNYQILV